MHMKKIYMIGAMLLMLMATSCHQESDSLLAYDHFDKLAFGDATNSFASKFKVTWNGLNQYYAFGTSKKSRDLTGTRSIPNTCLSLKSSTSATRKTP